MRNQARITAEMIAEHGHCVDQLEVFRCTWPRGVVPTLANCRKAVRLGLDLFWAVNHLFCAPALKAYREAIAPAHKMYNEAIAPARKAYNEAIESARKAYDEAVAPALKAYNEEIESAHNTYDEAAAPARKAYNEAIASAFAAAWRHNHPNKPGLEQ